MSDSCVSSAAAALVVVVFISERENWRVYLRYSRDVKPSMMWLLEKRKEASKSATDEKFRIYCDF